MREFKPTGHLGLDAEEFARVVFDNAISDLISKILTDIEESGISAEMAKQVPEWLADAIERRNKMALTVSRFRRYPEQQAADQWQHP